MGAFKSAVITKKGQELLAKVVAGTTKLEFTKIKVSDAKLSGDLASMTGIGTIKQEEKVASVVRKNGSNVTVSASFSNQTLGQGYYVRNLGLYANDPQSGEILYSISVADESTATADYMDMATDADINIEHRLTEVDARARSNTKRLDEHDEILKSNSEMIGAIKELATEVKYMRGDLNETVERLNKLEGKDGDKWDKFKWLIVAGLVTLILGYLAVSLGLK